MRLIHIVMIGLPVEFAFIKPGDDFHWMGERYCKITPHHGESLTEGRRVVFEATFKVVHATNLPLFTPRDLLDAQAANLSPLIESEVGY